MSSKPTRSGGRHQLVVLRHAKAEAFAPDDAERRLTPRGCVDAGARGRWLAQRAGNVDLALVSSATRARQTWELASAELAGQPELRLDDGLYNASPDTVLDLLRALPESITTVVYVGHNPTAASLALLLHDGAGDPAAFSSLSAGLSPCGVAVYDLAGPWQDLDAGTGSLVAVDA